jgi:hypothetical protein
VSGPSDASVDVAVEPEDVGLLLVASRMLEEVHETRYQRSAPRDVSDFNDVVPGPAGTTPRCCFRPRPQGKLVRLKRLVWLRLVGVRG